MVLATHAGIGIHLLRLIFSVIDRIVYWALMEIYNLLDQISRVNIFGEGTISEFSERLYTIIGVLMLFKLAFSIINYIVDPDKLTDSKKGFSSIVKNIVIMLALIVTVPLIFKYAMALQYVIVSDNTIGRLITGKEGATTTNVGDNMSVAILSGFIHPDHGIKGCEESENYSSACQDAIISYGDLEVTYNNAYFGERGYNALIELAQSTETMGDGNYVITYNFLLSTIVGGFTAWILLIFCIDIAVRVVKLGFLQLIAPIPIVTYMDDGGQGMFKKWVDVCKSTYIDLFVRLAAIDFAIYIISAFLISSENDSTTLTGNFKICEWSFNESGSLVANCNEQAGFFIKLFLILGTLMFAKQLPKILKDLGLDLGGKFTLNPMKKIADEAIGGKAISKGLGLAGRTAGNLAGFGWAATGGKALGAVGDAIANKYNGSELQKKIGKARSGAGGVFAAVDNFGGNYLSRIGLDAQGTFGQLGNFGNKRNAAYKKVSDQADKLKKNLVSDIQNNKAGKYSDAYRQMQADLDVAKSMSEAEFAASAYSYDANGNAVTKAEYLARQSGAIGEYLNKTAPGLYFDDMKASGFAGHQDYADEYKIYANLAQNAGVEVATTYGGIKTQKDDLDHKIREHDSKQVAVREVAKGNK